MSSQRPESYPDFDPSVPNEARILDYLMGGKDNFAADREAARAALSIAPDLPMMCREARKFLSRVVHFLVANDVDQFIDIGCGLPTQGSVHEILRPIAPDARLAYVDNDPVVVTHAAAVIGTGQPVKVFRADARAPDALLDRLTQTGFIDLDRPVAVLLHSLLAVIPEDDVAEMIVDRLTARMVPGSYLLVSHAISDTRPETTVQLAKLYQEQKVVRGREERSNLRTTQEVAQFMRGLELVPPGLVPLPAWRPDAGRPDLDPAMVWAVGGLGRKPN